MEFKLKVDGLEELKKMLATLPDDVNAKIQADINRAGANIVKKELQAAAPEGDSTKKSGQAIAENVIIKKNGKASFLIGFSKRVWYVKLLELGTKVRQTLGGGKYKEGANRGKIDRKPFIEQAHYHAAKKVTETISEKYLSIINRSIKKQLKKF
jgi:HK97 gp10 family phage protein